MSDSLPLFVIFFLNLEIECKTASATEKYDIENFNESKLCQQKKIYTYYYVEKCERNKILLLQI